MAKRTRIRRLLRFVELVSLSWHRGRLRALREARPKDVPAPVMPAKPAKPPSFSDHIYKITSGKLETSAAQAEWTRNEESGSVFAMGAPSQQEQLWQKNRAARIAKLRHLHNKDKQNQFGLDHDEMAAQCGIPAEVARGLREDW
jgi:hypothetical protein